MSVCLKSGIWSDILYLTIRYNYLNTSSIIMSVNSSGEQLADGIPAFANLAQTNCQARKYQNSYSQQTRINTSTTIRTFRRSHKESQCQSQNFFVGMQSAICLCLQCSVCVYTVSIYDLRLICRGLVSPLLKFWANGCDLQLRTYDLRLVLVNFYPLSFNLLL